MRHIFVLVAVLAFVPLASATAQEQLRDVRTTTLAAANSVLVSHPGQWREPVFVLVPFQPASHDCLSLDRSLLADFDGGSSADYLLSTDGFDPG